jgi:hypothetical protein
MYFKPKCKWTSSYRKYLFVVIIRIVQDCISVRILLKKNLLFEQKKKLKQKSCFKSGKFMLFKIDMHLVGQFELIFV